MPLLRLFPSGAQDPSAVDASPARLINLYPEPTQRSGRTGALLRSVYGLASLASLGGVFIRDMIELNGAAYALRPFGLARVTGSGAVEIYDPGVGGSGCLSRNYDILTACMGGRYFTLNPEGDVIATPDTGPIDGVAWVEFLAGRTLIGEQNSAKFAWSDAADPSFFPGLNFAVAESRADNLVRGVVVGSALMLFGERSTELWAPAGVDADAFAPLPGAVKDVGLLGFDLIAKAESGAFLIGSDGIAYLAAGMDWQAVSGPSVNYSIKHEGPQSCLYWEERGHKFCAIAFDQRPAWVFDMTTGEWFERGLGIGAWPARAAVKLGDDWLIGANTGDVYALRPITTDAGQHLVRQATSLPIENSGNWFRLAALELMFPHGFAPGKFTLEVGSGVAFGQPRIVSLPGVGEFDGRVVLRALGAHRRAVVRLTLTDDLDLSIYADANVVLA